MREQEGCIVVISCWLLFKCKTIEIFFIEFVLLDLFYNCIMLFLHIEHLYKVGQRYLFGQVLTAFIELVGQAYRLYAL